MNSHRADASTLASDIATAIGFPFADADVKHPVESESLNSDGAWEYHFDSDPAWGFVAAGPDEAVTTTYNGVPYLGRKITVEPSHWCVFHEETPVAVLSSTSGTVGGPAALEERILTAFQAEIDVLTKRSEDR